MTCCFFSSLKTLLTFAEGIALAAEFNVLDGGLSLAGFQVIINSRFWVFTEGQRPRLARLHGDSPVSGDIPVSAELQRSSHIDASTISPHTENSIIATGSSHMQIFWVSGPAKTTRNQRHKRARQSSRGNIRP